MIEGDEVRRLLMSLPEVEERETWGHPTFRVRDKIFATLAPDGSDGSVRTSKQEQAMLLASDPETFKVADYVGRHGWVTVDLSRVDPELLRGLIVDAWRRTAPKRVAAAYDAAR